jgi:hypothetical protein
MDVTLRAFTDVAQQAGNDDRAIKLSGDALKDVGALGAAFTTKATNRQTMTTFLDALRNEYGDSAAQLASDRLAGALADGKPLTARMVRQAAADARTGALGTFISGVDFNGQPVAHSLDSAIDAYLDSRDPPCQLTPDQKHLLRENLAKGLLLNNSNFANAQEMFTSVSQGKFGGLEDMVNMLGHTSESLHANAAEGSMADKCHLVAVFSSMLTSPGHSPSAELIPFVLRHLPQMRELQPSGELKPETVWRACFGEEPPASLLGAAPGTMTRAMEDKVESMIQNFASGLSGDEENTQGHPFTVSRSAAQRDTSVRFAFMSLSPDALHAARNGRDIDGSLDLTGGNFNRRAAIAPEDAMFRMLGENVARGNFRGAPLQFSFQNGTGQPELLRMNPGDMRAGAYTDIRNRYHGTDEADAPLRAFTDNFRTCLNAMAGSEPIPDRQQNSLFMAMGQNGNFPLVQLERAIGRPFDPDHSAHGIALTREPNGDITVHHLINDVAEGGAQTGRARLSIVVHPDGTVDSRAQVWARAEAGAPGSTTAAENQAQASQMAARLFTPAGYSAVLNNLAGREGRQPLVLTARENATLTRQMNARMLERGGDFSRPLIEADLRNIRQTVLSEFSALCRTIEASSLQPQDQRFVRTTQIFHGENEENMATPEQMDERIVIRGNLLHNEALAARLSDIFSPDAHLRSALAESLAAAGLSELLPRMSNRALDGLSQAVTQSIAREGNLGHVAVEPDRAEALARQVADNFVASWRAADELPDPDNAAYFRRAVLTSTDPLPAPYINYLNTRAGDVPPVLLTSLERASQDQGDPAAMLDVLKALRDIAGEGFSVMPQDIRLEGNLGHQNYLDNSIGQTVNRMHLDRATAERFYNALNSPGAQALKSLLEFRSASAIDGTQATALLSTLTAVHGALAAQLDKSWDSFVAEASPRQVETAAELPANVQSLLTVDLK